MNFLYLIQETIHNDLQETHKVAEHAAEDNWILHHLQDSNVFEFFTKEIHLPHFELFGIDFSITKHVVMLWLAALIITVVFLIAGKGVRLIPKGFINLIELIVVFVRDSIVYVNFGKKGKPLVPFFLTMFVYIFVVNLLGIFPLCSTATGNITITGALALISFVVIQGAGIKQNGLLHYFKNIVPPGLPWYILPFMIPVEIIGMLAKPFALAVRLYANMTGGHTVLYVLIGMIITFKTWLIVPPPILMAVVIDIFEIFIAALQSYIFCFLTSLFVSLTMFPEH